MRAVRVCDSKVIPVNIVYRPIILEYGNKPEDSLRMQNFGISIVEGVHSTLPRTCEESGNKVLRRNNVVEITMNILSRQSN